MMWDELVPIYTSGGCTCRVTAILEKKREDERVHQFLMRLDDAIYGMVCSNILSMEPLSNLNRGYAMIVQEERHRSINVFRIMFTHIVLRILDFAFNCFFNLV